MKLRLKGNSLRLRLTRSEITQLATERALQDETDFGCGTFRFALCIRENAAALSAVCEPDAIVVSAPAALIAHWTATDEVGLYAEQPTSRGGRLTIAVEKDFRCLDPRRDEDESDHFDHPLAGETRHGNCAEDGKLPAFAS